MQVLVHPLVSGVGLPTRTLPARLGPVVAQRLAGLPMPLIQCDDCLETVWIPIPTVPRSMRAQAEEVRRWREDLTPEEQVLRAYAVDSPNWVREFVLEHQEERHRGPPKPPEVLPEDHDE
ncbi:hypothetical protein D1007_45170 [Hordeum vulgare]|nr:hypothetical protein D1007_45170 [Hordeum vulgare]